MDDAPSTPSQRGNAWRVCGVVGLVATVALAVVNVAEVARRVPVPPLVASAGEPDVVMRQEQRLAALRRDVARRGLRGPIGYVGNRVGAGVLEDGQTTADFFLTQFALAPVVLDLSVERREWAVANLRGARTHEKVPAGFSVVEDFGDGVFLLRKAAP